MNVSIKIYFFLITKKISEAFPHAVLLSIIMSMGGLTQNIVTKFFTSEEANIYDTLYDGQIAISSADFIKWFTSYFDPLFIIPSLLIISIALKGGSAKKILIYISFLVFFTLMITDYFFCSSNNITNNYLLNGISNLIGSVIISMIVILSLDTGDVLNKYFENNNLIYCKLVDSIIAILFGLLIPFIIYITYKDIYTVTASKIDITMKFPVNGSYSINAINKEKLDESYGLFSSATSNIQNFSWTGISKNFSLEWEKNPSKQSQVYNAEVRVLDECYNDKSMITKALSSPPTYVIENMNKVKLTTDDGITDMYILQDNGKISASNEDEIQFNIEESKNKKYDLTRLIKRSTQIKHTSWIDKTSYSLTFINLDKLNSKTTIINREIHMQAGNKILKIKLLPNTNTKTNMKFNCKALPESKDGVYNLDSIFSGVILTLRELNTSNTILLDLDNPEETRIKGIGGWMTTNGIGKKELPMYINRGRLNSLNLTASIQELLIDDKEHKQGVSSSHIDISEANLTGGITAEGLLRFTGSSKSIYINEKRENLSRLEKLETEYKFMLFSLLSGIFLFIFKRFIVILNENKQYTLENGDRLN